MQVTLQKTAKVEFLYDVISAEDVLGLVALCFAEVLLCYGQLIWREHLSGRYEYDGSLNGERTAAGV